MSSEGKQADGQPPASSAAPAPVAPPWGPTAAALACLAAAWVAADSTGLLAHGLRGVLLWLALAVAVLAGWAGHSRSPVRRGLLVLAVAVAAAMTTSSLAPVKVLAAAVLLGALAFGRWGPARRTLVSAALGVTVLGIYRLACTSIPVLWIAADRLGGLMGRAVGALTGRPLWVGATFAGLDFLVAMGGLYAVWLVTAPRPRWPRGLLAAAAILAGHLLYLIVLAFAGEVLAMPPGAPAEQAGSAAGALRTLVPWNLPALAAGVHLAVAGAMLRWAPKAAAPRPRPRRRWLPSARWAATALLAAVIPVAVTLSAGTCSLEGKKVVAFESGFLNWHRPRHGDYGRLSIGMYGMLPTYVESLGGRWVRSEADSNASEHLSGADLKDADLLVLLYPNERWTGLLVQAVGTPAHGRTRVDPNGQVVLYTPAVGYRGEDSFAYTVRALDDANATATARVFVTVGDRRRAPTTAPADDRSARPVARDDRVEVAAGSRENPLHVLLNDAGPPGQLENIEQFVRRGGSLLVMGEHTVRERETGDSRFNEVLTPTDMRVRFDSATFAVGGWLHSYEAAAHPATAGIPDDRNEFGVVIGASMEIGWRARPLLVGRWGWADPGDEGGPAMMGNHRYDAGEKLGDLVLAAEQPLGEGTIVAFGDTSGITNGITIGAHRFTSRLLGYLASRPGSPQAAWRQAIGLLLAAGLVALLAWGLEPLRMTAAAAVLAGSLVLCTQATYEAAQVLPDRANIQRALQARREAPQKDPNELSDLAYIDAAHLGAYSEESWRPEGIGGLEMTLIRNGYLTLSLPEFTPERLRRAGLLVSIAPQREFTHAEMDALETFVRGGGIFLCTVGYEDRAASREMLGRFGMGVGTGPPGPKGEKAPEPQPMGHFKAPYLDTGTYRVYVRFHAAWPVWCSAADAKVVAYGRSEGQGELPVIIRRRFGSGQVVLIGDTGFARNENLERRDGRPIEGLRENADFWRWLLTALRDRPMWVPPREVPGKPATAPAGGKEGPP